MKFRTWMIAAALVSTASAAQAQQVSLSMRDGLVTLTAKATVAQILKEWARVGGVEVVNAEKIIGPVITIQLTGVTEREALTTLLRGVSGFMLATRPTEAPGSAVLNRIVILPTSAAPAPAPVAASRPFSPSPNAPAYVNPRQFDNDVQAGLDDDMPQSTPSDRVISFTGDNPRTSRPAGAPVLMPGFMPVQVQGGVPQLPPGQAAPASGATASNKNPFFTGSSGSGQAGGIAPIAPPPPADPNKPDGYPQTVMPWVQPPSMPSAVPGPASR